MPGAHPVGLKLQAQISDQLGSFRLSFYNNPFFLGHQPLDLYINGFV